ncbi:MAG: pyridoxal-phosphate dependent enzyme [Deltaproteobacteria bacterium]|nr:pyridoxal-phosphate dependent enzyme [Deltaproteobacteria bacterium]
MEKFYCPECHRTYSVNTTRWRCDCGSFLDLEFTPEFFTEKILKRRPDLWRYREAIPIQKDRSILSMGEGFTPLEEMEFRGRRVWVKIDYLFPTGSYKDRGAAVLISKARELGINKVVEDSSGNAGSAIAAYCAKAGIGCDIYVPQSTSSGKLVQIQTYGANLRKIEGSREKTAQVTMEAAKKTYYASHSWNPYFLHGTKTFAFEVWEQMGWKSPDTLILPVGHGTLLLGAYIGFKELKEAGKVKKIPRLVGIQSTACAPLYQGFVKELEEAPSIIKGETMAEGIAIAEPVRGKQILKAIRETVGEILTVTEREVMPALREMGRRGHFIEPTSAATIAGLKKYLKSKGRKEVIVSSLTGTGLKAVEKIEIFGKSKDF